jgi:mRNA-degrading endonuclease RelE of RelBE toxin-antitoxin system
MIRRVEISKLAAKQLRKLPRHIVDKFVSVEEVSKHDY